MIELIGAPFDLCGRKPGSRLGPVAMRLEGLITGLDRLGIHYTDAGPVTEIHGRWPEDRHEQYSSGYEAYKNLKAQALSSFEKGNTPLVMGGDHSVSIGSVSAALEAYGSDLGVLWIDAHMDLNTPSTSPSGNLHGMPLAALLRMDEGSRGAGGYWRMIQDDIVGEKGLTPGNLVWLGLRDVDAGEVSNLETLDGPLALTMQDIDEIGIVKAIKRVSEHLENSGVKKLWISFDVDSLDPIFAPGTGTAVRGGMTYREGHLVAETLRALMNDESCSYELAGLDVVEVNPLIDSQNETAAVAVEWILSLFGKTILHPVDPGRTER